MYTRSHIAHACGVRVHVNMSDPNLSSLFAEGQFADSPIGIHKTGIYALVYIAHTAFQSSRLDREHRFSLAGSHLLEQIVKVRVIA